MTDDLLDTAMDARLHAAGERWRAAHDTGAAVDTTHETTGVEELSPAPQRHRRRPAAIWALGATAAAVVAALVLGVVLLARSRSSTPAADGLIGTVWQANGAWGKTLLVVGPGGGLVIDDDCALVSAGVRTSGDALTLASVDARDKSCVEPTLLSRWRLRDGARLGYRLRGADLVLRASSGAPVTFTAAPATTPAPTTDFPTLTGATWRLTGATDAGGHRRAVTGEATLRIDRGRLTAGDTCNTLSATARRTDSGFVIGDVGTTEIGCPGNTVPDLIDRTLTGAVAATLRDNTLTITKPGIGHLDYLWSPQNPSTAGLVGRAWTVSAVMGDRARIRADLRFDGTRVTGSDGCRPIDGTVAIAAGALTVTGAQATETCSPQASTLVSVLHQRVTLWRIQDGRLVLYGGNAQWLAIVLTTPTPPSPLEGSWRLTTVETGTTAQQGFGATLVVRNAEAELTVPCLKLRGPVRASSIRLSGTAERGCYGPMASPMSAGTYAWTITDGQLRLTHGRTTLVFTPA